MENNSTIVRTVDKVIDFVSWGYFHGVEEFEAYEHATADTADTNADLISQEEIDDELGYGRTLASN